MHQAIRCCLVIPALAGIGLASVAYAQPPVAQTLLPSAVTPGQTTTVILQGQTLNNPTGVWQNAPGAAWTVVPQDPAAPDPAKVTYSVTVPADCPLGIYGLRAATGAGISGLRLFMVDDLPTLMEAGGNNALASAQELQLPGAVEGNVDAQAMDYYKVSGVQGMRLTLEVVSRRLGYPLDPVIRVLDESGKELAYSDDEPGLFSDCQLQLVFPATATYYIEVRDIQYAGGGTHQYRLRAGDFPLAIAAFPPVIQAGASATLNAASLDALDVPTAKGPAAIAADADPYATFRRLAGGFGGSRPVRLGVNTLASQVEFEPNDAKEAASLVTLPGGINGTISGPADKDLFAFDGVTGQRWLFTGVTRTLGAPTDLFLRVLNADGAVILEGEDSGTDEGVLDFSVPADGRFYLQTEDLLKRGGPEFVYHIKAEAYQPGFSLSVEVDKLDVPQGGVGILKVVAGRRDFAGPITLTLEGLPPNTVLANNVIPENQPEVVMSFTLPADLAAGAPLAVQVMGTARIGERDVVSQASALVPLRVSLAGLPYFPESLTRRLGLGVGPVFADFFSLKVEGGRGEFTQLLGTGSLTIGTDRLNGFDDQVTLSVEGLPPGFAATVNPIAKGTPNVAIALTGPASAALGEFNVRVIGSGNFQNQPKSVTLASVPVAVVAPLKVSVATPAVLAPAGSQVAKVTLGRIADHKSPVRLRLRGLPPGVTAPADLIVPEGAVELDITLQAAESAASIKAEQVSVIAETDFQGKNIAVESSPFVVEVVKP